MITASVRSPTKNDRVAVTTSNNRSALCNCRPQHFPHPDPAHRDHVRSHERAPTDNLGGAQTSGRGFQALSHEVTRQRGRFGDGQSRGYVLGPDREGHRPIMSVRWMGPPPVDD